MPFINREPGEGIVQEMLPSGPSDVIIIFSGSAVADRSAKGPVFYSTKFETPDTRNKLGWGQLRLVAGAQRARQFPHARVALFCWSVNRTGNRTPLEFSDSSIMAAELLLYQGLSADRLQINNGRDDTHPAAFDTFTELLTTLAFALDNPDVHTLDLVVTAFQIERTKAMLKSLQEPTDLDEQTIYNHFLNYQKRFPHLSSTGTIDYFRDMYSRIRDEASKLKNKRIRFVIAESVVSQIDYQHEKAIERISATPEYQAALEAGAKGTKDWESGTYGN